MLGILNNFESQGKRRKVSPAQVAEAGDMVRAERHLARVRDRALQDFYLNVR